MVPARTIVLLAGWMLLALPPFAGAQEIPSPYRFIETAQEAGGFVGFTDASRGRLGLGPEGGPTFGARYSIELSGPFSVEGVGTMMSSSRDVLDPRRSEGDRRVGEADVLLTTVDARLKFSLTGRRTWNSLSPHALAGVGLGFDLAEDAAVETGDGFREQDRFDFGTSFLGLVGLGARWLPSDHWQFRVDGTLNLWQLETPDGWLDLASEFENPPPENEWVAGLGLTFGVSYRW